MAAKFNIGDKVYLIESARMGYLDVHEVVGVRQIKAGNYLYLIEIQMRPPVLTAPFGDRNLNKLISNFELDEPEITDICTALALAEAFHTAQLAKITTLRQTYCSTDGSGSGSDGGSGSGSGSG